MYTFIYIENNLASLNHELASPGCCPVMGQLPYLANTRTKKVINFRLVRMTSKISKRYTVKACRLLKTKLKELRVLRLK